ncbi:FUSC family protein, partial [Patescibacteria group bacterium]|nr:FUSC family protein [Patescibacteria group bacterium]
FKIISLVIMFVIGKLILDDDLVTRKIRNKWILFGLIFGEILFFSFLVIGQISNEYITTVWLNSALALLLGFLMWYAQVWPAGDAKFFALFAFLLPLEYYNKSYVPIFPSVVLLVNIFIPFLFFIFIKAAFLFLSDLIFEIKKSSMNVVLIKFWNDTKKQFLKLLVNLKNPKYYLINISKITLKYLLYFFILHRSFQIQLNISKIIYYFIFFLALNRILGYYYNKSEMKIRVEELKPGMNLSEVERNKIIEKKEFLASLGRFMAEGLTIEQVEKIKIYYFSNNHQEINIVKSLPFSVWIILGALITIFKANIFITF